MSSFWIGAMKLRTEMNKRCLRGYTIPVYESDGVTRIGVFQIGGPGVKMEGRTVDGGKMTMEAGADGTVAVKTEALDGTITTKTYEHQADVPKVETPKATVRTVPSTEPDRPQPWLLERMSQLARDAGDAHATAWWALQTRCYLKPIEGDKMPESPHLQWETVWLVVLHGNFAGADWRYWLLDQDTHNVFASGRSDRRFVMSGPRLPPPQGPIALGGK